MNNFIFKSPKRLIKNDSISNENLYRQMDLVLMEQRHARQDLKDIKLMLNKLLVDKHLQMQVDNYFGEDSEHFPETSPQTDSDEQ